MERSSPLAAMQPPAIPFGHGHWNFGMERPTSNPSMRLFRPNNFNFRDLSMDKKQQQQPDYFNMQPHRGASPTSSLAVDLSQNFHIDRSPQPPTPRRSLFSTNLLGALHTRESLVTPPPIPSSSPSPMLDSMEISPLPHKAPFVSQVQVQSPTPEPTPSTDAGDSMMTSPCMIPESPIEALKPAAPIERRRPGLLRPPLTRVKGLSTTALHTKSATAATFPSQAFLFGNCNAPSPTLTLDECFAESPGAASTADVLGPCMGPPRPKSASQKTAFFAQPTGSPSAGPVRSQPAPYQRRRKAIRRSLSMVDKPADVFSQQAQNSSPDVGLNAIMDVDETPHLSLPHFTIDNDPIPRITKETMADVLDGSFNEHYVKTTVIDCRFEYEYKGGHIEGAINFNSKEELAQSLFQEPMPEKTLLILHCEYSEFRAPMAASYLRCQDRTVNTHQYPKLTFPDVYILSGGYSAFFDGYKSRCFPQNYVEMKDEQHSNACERALGRIKQQRNKLSRAQTFAFGQRNQVEESPTALGRQTSDLTMGMDLSVDSPIDSAKRMSTRRQASF